MASQCYVTAADYKQHFTAPVCPKCGYTSEDLAEFAVWFCPSEPDRCNGCEVDPTCRQCPECAHEWRFDR